MVGAIQSKLSFQAVLEVGGLGWQVGGFKSHSNSANPHHSTIPIFQRAISTPKISKNHAKKARIIQLNFHLSNPPPILLSTPSPKISLSTQFIPS